MRLKNSVCTPTVYVRSVYETYISEFTFCGLLLEANKPLSSYGVTSGVTIHVIEKPKPKENSKPDYTKITEAVIQDFISSYRNFRVSPSFRSTLHVSINSVTNFG